MSKIAFNERVILVDILAVIFGISSWVEVNGVWVETPILVERLPERWNLASYVVMITQLANIGPIVYSILKFKYSLKSIERPAIHSTLLIGSVACLLLTFFWDKTTEINGSQHSVSLLVLTALLAVIDCTTSVLYLPYMAHFKSKYLMSYLIGQGLSGLIPSIVAIIQGIGGNPKCVANNSTTDSNQTHPEYSEPRFSVSVFFVILLCLVLLSWLAFVLLNHLKSCQSERVSFKDSDDDQHLKGLNAGVELDSSHSTDNNPSDESKLNNESSLTQNNEQNLSQKSFMILLGTQAFICALTNGVLPSIQSYSCLPYGNTTYHLTVTLSSMANPIACFIAFYISARLVKRTLPLVVGLGTVCAAYIIATAVLSPTPPLQDTSIGNILIVLTWIAFTALFSYSRACIASILRNTSTGHKSLFFCGVFTQIGSTIGAIFMFVLINFTKIFVPFIPCT